MSRPCIVQVALAASLAAGCFGGSTEAPAPAAAVAPPVAPVAPVSPVAPVAPVAAAAPAGPIAVQPGGPPAEILVPQPPAFSFTVAQAGEYQVDVMGQPLDAQVFLFLGDEMVGTDSDSGDGNDARFIAFLQPGTYVGRVTEFRMRQLTARVQVQALAPLTPAGAISPGQTLPVAAPGGPDRRAAASELTLTISTPGNYRIDAASEGFDAELDLIQGAALLQHSSDDGDGNNAQIVRQLTPGTYSLRVWDFGLRAATINLTVAQQ